MRKLNLLLGLVLCSAAHAQTTQPDNTGFNLTVYSTADPATFDPKQIAQQRLQNPYAQYQQPLPGYGVVRETRKIDLQAGENELKFTDVASGIDPTTVSFQSLTAPDTTAVLEQNYEYDVTNSEKLLKKYLDQQITLSRRLASTERPTSSTGTLLASDGQNIVFQPNNAPVEIIPRSDLSSISLTNTAGLITKPTLIWKIAADKPGPHDAQVTYQTDGLTWRADYNITINPNDTAADIGAWVTLLNESGASYPNAHLKLVAGDVQRIQPPQSIYSRSGFGGGGAIDMMKSTGFQEKSFFEYHLYTLGRTTTLADNSTKQIELFPAHSNIPLTKTYVYYGLPENMRYWLTPEPNQDRNLGTQSNKKVDIYLLMQNSEKVGLGIPLPAGRIRVYKRDPADESLEFIGEDVIQHTPKDEQVMVKLGTAFDIVGERTQTDFKADYNAHWIQESIQVKLRNHKKEPVHVIVKENLFRWVNWEITDSSDKWEKQDSRTIHIPVDVPVDGEKTVTYTVKYTW